MLDTETQRAVYQGRYFTLRSTYTNADVRMITQRYHPATGDEVVCVEPSPDIAKALSTAVSGQVQGGNGAVTASIGAQAASGEALAELAGRSTALLGLRDGLFRACEAYANGAIGQDAYGLVLARYGQLMTTLFLGQDITGASGSDRSTNTDAVIEALAAANPAGATTPKSPAAPAPKGKVTSASYTGTGLPRLWLAAFSPDQGTAAAPKVGGEAAPKANRAAAPKSGGAAPSKAATSATAPAPSSSAAVSDPLTLVRMNEDYIHEGQLGLLLVACINEFDGTRASHGARNEFLQGVCPQMQNVDKIFELAEKEAKGVHWVEPAAAATPGAAPSKKAKP